jgi:hypothetical protein
LVNYPEMNSPASVIGLQFKKPKKWRHYWRWTRAKTEKKGHRAADVDQDVVHVEAAATKDPNVAVVHITGRVKTTMAGMENKSNSDPS